MATYDDPRFEEARDSIESGDLDTRFWVAVLPNGRTRICDTRAEAEATHGRGYCAGTVRGLVPMS